MSLRPQIPLGTRIPNTLHAVSVSLPTMADVIGYEKRDPLIVSKIKSGYPRFVVHECLKAVEAYWQRLFDKPTDPVWLTSSEKMARKLEVHLGRDDVKFQKHGGLSGLRVPKDEALNQKAKLFLQHVGGYLCSRQAEDYLVANDLKESAEGEALFGGNARMKIIDILKPLLGSSNSDDIVLCNTGMNAVYATFEAINAIQAPKGRHSWIKLGWLYADTMHILDKLSSEKSVNEDLYDVFDLARLEEMLANRPNEFAAIITEAPTNPLIQTMDVARLRDLANKYGVFLIVDPTINSPANVDVSPYADVIVTSLTKYAANAGDVAMGAIRVADHCVDREELLSRIKEAVEPCYSRTMQRLAFEIDGYLPLIQTSNASALKVVEHLEKHPRIKKVYWSKESKSASNYERIARSSDSVGSMISFTLKGDLADFYDRLPLAKGPSFGTTRTLACPFIYLAHYDLISTSKGKVCLDSAHIDPDLIRFSIGAEPVEEIISALDFALAPDST